MTNITMSPDQLPKFQQFLDNNNITTLPQNLYFPPPAFIGTIRNQIDLNQDPDLRKRMVKYFREKTLKWLRTDEDFNDLVSCFTLENNKAVVGKCVGSNLKDRDALSESIFWDHIYPSRLVKKTLHRYIELSRTNWYDLKDNRKYVKRAILHVLKKNLLKKE